MSWAASGLDVPLEQIASPWKLQQHVSRAWRDVPYANSGKPPGAAYRKAEESQLGTLPGCQHSTLLEVRR